MVSILIPVYNRETLIEETIKSALNQSYNNIEVIVVDNKSIDNTWEILIKLAKQDNRIKIFQNETNIGPVRNWKRCIDKASGEYGKILWSDDLIAPNFIERTLPFLSNNDIGFVFTGTEIFTDETNKKSSCYFIGNTGIYNSEQYINGVLSRGNYPVSPGCALFRLKDIQENLLVDIPNKVSSNFAMHAIGNDLLIFLLTADKYKYFAFVNEKLSFFRAHIDSISIQSADGKLPLNYALASAYFVEKYRNDLVKKMNTELWLTIQKYKNGARKYSLDQISHFYLTNTIYSFDFIYLTKRILRKIISKFRYKK
ncbi:glycosyltransferase family 2 protein [Sulfurovum sp.]|uniref:glycosyltransferase family 2 protein n=1 Tax=Sulfurovum sp. TaxID=1969726 RepID=UPI003561C157